MEAQAPAARVKLNMELSTELADKITRLREPLGIPQSAAIRHLLVIGIAAVNNDHAGSLAGAIESASKAGDRS